MRGHSSSGNAALRALGLSSRTRAARLAPTEPANAALRALGLSSRTRAARLAPTEPANATLRALGLSSRTRAARLAPTEPANATLRTLGRVCAALAPAAALALGACTGGDHYVTVTVDARPAVHGAASISVGLSNAGSSRTDRLALRAQPFPVTFSVSAPGRTGDLDIAVAALDDDGALVGRGTATARIDAATARVVLDPADFVVNTDYPGDQFPSDDNEAGGFQVAALPDGTWTTVFRDACPTSSCSLFARRFDKSARPVQTQAAAGTNAFLVTGRPTLSLTTPAIAAGQAEAIAVWNFYDVGAATTSGVACRTLDTGGRLGADQTTVAGDNARVVSVAAMANDNFVAQWRTIAGNGDDQIRMVIIKPDCTALGAVQTVAEGAQVADLLHRGSVAASADHVLLTWITNGDAHLRMATSTGGFSTADTALVTQTQTDELTAMRAAGASGGGFVVAVRWAQKVTSSGAGRIELYRINPSGAVAGMPVLVTDRAGSDSASSESLALASRPDGSVLVAWQACDSAGDGSLCGVFGRILRDTGEPVTDAFVIPTTTDNDQRLPSVAALPDGFVAVWSDGSLKPPDPSGMSVRARVLYPP